LTFQSDDVAAESPVVSILEVTSTTSYQLDIEVEISLSGFIYNEMFTETLNLYLNQSIDTIIANSYDSYNKSQTLSQVEETFTTSILSPVLTNGSHLDSAYYNITLVAITNTDEKSTPVEWSGGYYFIDTDLPVITFVNPSAPLEKVWGIYTVEVNVIDISNISQVIFYMDDVKEFEYKDPNPTQTAFTWDWLTSLHSRGQHTIKVRAIDNSDAKKC
jgi:hypothetical protein